MYFKYFTECITKCMLVYSDEIMLSLKISSALEDRFAYFNHSLETHG